MTESYNTLVSEAQTAAERSAEVWKQSTQRVSDQAKIATQVPLADLSQGLERYFDYVAAGAEVNREFLRGWFEAVGSTVDLARGQVTAAVDAWRGHGHAIEEWIRGEAEVVEHTARETVSQVEQADKEQQRQARQAERALARREHQHAREAYEGRTKAELSDLLVERDLPKTGTVDELIERLVAADSD